MYYVYYIPKRGEWGCTENLEARVERLGYKMSDLERVIIVSNVDKAADMERDLNIEYGFGWNDSQDYRRVIKMAIKGGEIRGKSKENIEQLIEVQKIGCVLGGLKQGPIQGKKNAESGLISALGKKNSEFNNRIRTCPHCGIITRGIGYERWHGDKCRKKLNP